MPAVTGRCLLRHLLRLALLSLLALALPAAAITRSVIAGHSVSHWTVEDGLAHNLPLAITQDRAGWLWVSTWEGVARFNGHDFTVFDRHSAGGADMAGAGSLLAEADGSVLVGTDHGVFRHQTGQWQPVPGLAGVRAEKLYRARDGVLWIASGNQLVALQADGTLRRIALGNGPRQVFGIAQLPDDQLLLGCEGGLFVLAGGQVLPWQGGRQLAGQAVFDIAADGDGWLLSSIDGTWRLDARSRLQPLGPRVRINRAARGRDGRLWLNPHDGPLLVIDGQGRTTEVPLPGVRARDLYVDRDGGLWSGSPQGLYRLVRGAAQQLAGSEGYMRAVLEDGRGQLWLAHGGGVRLVGRDGKVRELLDGMPGLAGSSAMSLALARDGDGVWVGTYDRGVLHIGADGRLRQRIAADLGYSSGLVRTLLQTRDGSLWVGHAVLGLQRWHDGVQQSLPAPDRVGLIQVLQADADNGVWVGSTQGLSHVSADGHWQRWTCDDGLPARSVFDILVEPDGTLWLATDRGLVRRRHGRFDVLDISNGLPQERLFRILDDGDSFWLSSNRGVLQLSRRQVEAVLDGGNSHLSVWVVDHADGLPGQTNGGTWPAGWRSHDGRLLFPTGGGIGEVLPARLQASRGTQLPVVLEQVHVDGQPRSHFGRVVLPPDARRLRISYTGLDFQAPGRVHYRHRLVGFDRDWLEAGRTPGVSYTNLPPGRYRFELEAITLPREWDDRARVGSTSLEIVVLAPLWRQPAVIVLAVLSLGGLVYGLYRWRIRRFELRQQHLKRIIDASTRALTVKNDLLEANARERDALMKQLVHQASHDALTGLPNRRAAEQYLLDAIAGACTSATPLSVALLDVDHFKGINDSYGHDTGDQVLCALARRLAGLREAAVYSARHGGEEFLLILPGIGIDEAWQKLDQLRAQIAGSTLELDNERELHYTVSIGLAAYGAQLGTIRQLLACADRNLYLAKGQGRNRVIR